MLVRPDLKNQEKILPHSPFQLCLCLSQEILRQLVDTAIDMHSKGVFHRDIKLHNVLVQSDSGAPRVRVIDFGCGTFSTEMSYSSFCGVISGFCSSLVCQSLK